MRLSKLQPQPLPSQPQPSEILSSADIGPVADPKKPVHGGRLIAASKKYGMTAEHWLDLSTGISPDSWPVPPVPESVWRELPQPEDKLLQRAADYYGCSQNCLLPIPGSQFAIETLPHTVNGSQSVALPYWGYQEHYYHWQKAGHQIVCYKNTSELLALVQQGEVNSAVVINPNNPSADLMDTESLLGVAEALSARGGLLVVDEAFIDAQPEFSVCEYFGQVNCNTSATENAPEGLVVLRSVGKFFGLAGLRLGFAVAHPRLLARLAEALSPWAVSHPARWVGEQALADKEWQCQQRSSVVAAADLLLSQVEPLWPQLSWRKTPLFVTGFGPWKECYRLYEKLAQQAVLVRLLEPVEMDSQAQNDKIAGIRIGLPLESKRELFIRAVQSVNMEFETT